MPTIDNYTHSYSEEYPRLFSLGLTSVLLQRHKLFFQQNIILFSDLDPSYQIRIGYEYYTPFDMVIRCGLKGEDDLRCGFGYTFNLTESTLLIFDYSLHLGTESEGISHLFTWSTRI